MWFKFCLRRTNGLEMLSVLCNNAHILLGVDRRLMQFIKKWKDTLVVRLKIIVAHFQVVSAFPKVLDVQWPDAFDR